MSREREDQLLDQVKAACQGRSGPPIGPEHITAMVTRLDRVLTAILKLRCLVTMRPCIERNGPEWGAQCLCANCEIHQEVWHG